MWKGCNHARRLGFKSCLFTLGLAVSVLSMGWVGCATHKTDETPLTVVDSVDLQRYLGKWYEIASYPAWFQKDCTGSTAEYDLLPDGRIQVVNRCFEKQLDGPLKESEGKAEVDAMSAMYSTCLFCNRALGFKCKAGNGVIRGSHFIDQAAVFETSLTWREGFLPHDIEVTGTRFDWFCFRELGLLSGTVRGIAAERMMPRVRVEA